MCVFKIEPLLVSDLRVVSVGMRNTSLAWKNDNGTATCWILLEDTGRHELVNMSDLRPESQYKVLCLLEPNETQGKPLVTESSSGELYECASHLLDGLTFSN